MLECANGHEVSSTAGTVLRGTSQPLLTWFQAVYLITTLTRGIPALQFRRRMESRRHETAFGLLHEVRRARVAPGREPPKSEVMAPAGPPRRARVRFNRRFWRGHAFLRAPMPLVATKP